jgi:hypothetical protein
VPQLPRRVATPAATPQAGRGAASALNEVRETVLLRLFLRVLSLGFVAAFVPWITLILLNAPLLAPGGALAPLLRFQPYNAPYETMLTAIYLTWAVMLWRASEDPTAHTLFVDFTMWANAAHVS